MSNSHPRGGTHQHQRLAERFDQRATRLRRQAGILLGIIIAVLVGGAGAFVFANDIARLTLQPQTAEAQYAKASTALNEIKEQEASLQKQRSEILNEASIQGPANEKIAKIENEYAALEKDILQHCGQISNIRNPQDLEASQGHFSWYDDIKVIPSQSWIGEYELTLPSFKTISFENSERANACRDQFVQHRDEIVQYARAIQNILNEEHTELQETAKRNASKLEPLNERGRDLYAKDQELNVVLNTLKPRAAQEKFFGPGVNLGGQGASDKTDNAKTDWARVIETNATRIGALVTMFFLVTILVPQYRYNIRMASFYEARSDSLGMLPEAMSAEDFDKVVSIMTPNIDFGKAPPTPWEQIIEVIKTAKS